MDIISCALCVVDCRLGRLTSPYVRDVLGEQGVRAKLSGLPQHLVHFSRWDLIDLNLEIISAFQNIMIQLTITIRYTLLVVCLQLATVSARAEKLFDGQEHTGSPSKIGTTVPYTSSEQIPIINTNTYWVYILRDGIF